MTVQAIPLTIVAPFSRGASVVRQPARALHKAASKPPQPVMSNEDRQAMRAGVRQERRRWMTVLKSRAFGGQAATIGAHLLANTGMSADAILGVLRAVAADAEKTAAANPTAIQDRWASAFQRISDVGR